MNRTSGSLFSESISRREAIGLVGVLLGHTALVGAERMAFALDRNSSPAGRLIGSFTVADIAFLDEIAETILPATKTPGAKTANTGAFVAMMVNECYSPLEQRVFREGMQRVDAETVRVHDVSFMRASASQRLTVLATFDLEQKTEMDAREAATRRERGLAPAPSSATAARPDIGAVAQAPAATVAATPPGSAAASREASPKPFFRMMKELTLLGYFTSEVGCTQALRFVEVPGRYDPCVPYAAGEPAWAEHA